MEQTFLDSLQGLSNGEVKGTSVSTYVNVEFSGSVKLERGAFSMVIHFYCKVSESRHKGVVSIDDWDVNDSSDFIFNGLPLDSITNFKNKLTEWGISSVGKKLDFTNEEQRRAICECMLKDEEVKKVYGKNFKIWDILSDEEKKLLDLKLVIEKFKTIGDHLKGEVGRYYKLMDNTQTYPTLKEYQAKLVELTK